MRSRIYEGEDAGLDVRLTPYGSVSALSARLELTVYPIVQEALSNAIKHAGDNVAVSISVEIDKQQVAVQVQDNGKGGDVRSTGGHGIAGMRERVDLIGGEFFAGGRSGGGFEIRARLPLKGSAQ